MSFPCCLTCHFEWELEHLWRYLTEREREELEWEHREIESSGYDDSLLLAHAQKEEEIARHTKAPLETFRELVRQHNLIESGQVGKH